ncbi:DUF1566 domain-containing protein [Arcobacter sp. CECT 8985]|uniref:Lcl domain-containing protein n=1 Tax=Arcobacter sp. CECT 8985 TaxID=1935424 RepID=UPI00100AB890|nr:DUF1566 domain-containing protein [Arcobacter sp. CECT 8985]RXJ83197.1 hypothetical protein CRU93_13990 [Arcobacter sp. CECT 8985]
MKNLIISITFILSIFNSNLFAEYVRDNKKEIVIDKNSNLMWQDNNLKRKNWNSAKKYCTNLTLANYNDWRLPYFNELFFLADKNKSQPAINNIFRSVPTRSYWTNTPFYMDSSYFWEIHFGTGTANWENKINNYYVRCVRTINKKKIIKKTFSRNNEKNIVTNNITKLQWQDNIDTKTLKKDWLNAKKYCDELDFSNYKNWRLPSVDELASITSKTKYKNVSFDIFKNSKGAYYWTSTPYKQNENTAWVVNFKGGKISSMSKTFDFNIRCVRDKYKSTNIDKKLNYKQLNNKFIQSIKDNNLTLSEKLLNQGANINVTDNNGSVLFIALKTTLPDKYVNISKIKKTADFLISKGINLELINYEDETALMSSLRFGNIKAFKYLVGKGANINHLNKDKENIIFYLIKSYRSDCKNCRLASDLMNYAIKNKVDLNSPDKYLRTPLHLAIIFERNKLMKILVENKADLNLKDSDGYTPIYFAIDNNDINTVKYLLKNGADLKVKDNDDNTPVDYAIQLKRVKIVNYLKTINKKETK